MSLASSRIIFFEMAANVTLPSTTPRSSTTNLLQGQRVVSIYICGGRIHLGGLAVSHGVDRGSETVGGLRSYVISEGKILV